MSEVGAVLWKELREHALRKGRPSAVIVGGLITAVLFGLVFPAFLLYVSSQVGGNLNVVETVGTVALFALPLQGFVVAMALIVDTVAGERERHTLETLLASPASARNILWGKLFAILAVAMAQALFEALGQATLLLSALGTEGFGYLPYMGAGLTLAVLATLALSCIGVVVAARAANVKSAQQTLGYLFGGFYLVGSLLRPVLQFTSFGRAIGDFQNTVGTPLFFWFMVVALSGLVAILYAWAASRFRRDRLIGRSK